MGWVSGSEALQFGAWGVNWVLGFGATKSFISVNPLRDCWNARCHHHRQYRLKDGGMPLFQLLASPIAP